MGSRTRTKPEPKPEPRTVVRIIEEHWRVVTGPIMCAGCGHEHYGRVSGAFGQQAPQWHICEDPECECTALVTWSKTRGSW